MTQLEMILNHIRKAGSISRREAMVDYSISNLTARISDLRQLGFNIATMIKKHPTTGQRYMRYTLA